MRRAVMTDRRDALVCLARGGCVLWLDDALELAV